MRRIAIVAAAILGAGLWGGAAWADWNLGDPYKMHYPQLPDIHPTGMDVLATVQGPWAPPPQQWKILADDWRCTESGPVSDIHLWGSWYTMTGLNPNPLAVRFKLSIHDDIPASPTNPYSQPGALRWQGFFEPTMFTVRPWPSSGPEAFFDPNLNAIIGTDNMIWQYNFTHLPNPFIQEIGKVYWLDVQAMPLDPEQYFGWKTTNPAETPHFLDDAVFADTAGFGGPPITPWRELVYPSVHPFAGHSIDLAFVITPEPASLGLLALGVLTLLRRRW